MNIIPKSLQYNWGVTDEGQFDRKRFLHNNKFTLILAFYLAIEQLYYAFCTSETGSLQQYIFLISSILMMIYAVVSEFIRRHKPDRVNWLYRVYELSFGMTGFIVAILRALLFKNDVFALPTVYIAVIYGFAVFFYYPPLLSLFTYLSTCIVMIILFPVFHSESVHNTYIQDIITNNIIAWMASLFCYYRYVKEYNGQQTIILKNKELEDKTIKIQLANRELQYMSSVDALTNVYNRRKLNDFLEIEYNKNSSSLKHTSVILMDIDYFKTINDTFGHTAGDWVLQQLGELLQNNVRNKDIVGRWGGEEFLIICPETEFEIAFEVAEKLRNTIELHDFGIGKEVTCSFGVATSESEDTMSSLIIRVDSGLYKAKSAGRNSVDSTNNIINKFTQ